MSSSKNFLLEHVPLWALSESIKDAAKASILRKLPIYHKAEKLFTAVNMHVLLWFAAYGKISCLYITSVQSWVKWLDTICSSHFPLYRDHPLYKVHQIRRAATSGVGEVWWMGAYLKYWLAFLLFAVIQSKERAAIILNPGTLESLQTTGQNEYSIQYLGLQWEADNSSCFYINKNVFGKYIYLKSSITMMRYVPKSRSGHPLKQVSPELATPKKTGSRTLVPRNILTIG